MKKLVSLLLALVMALGLFTAAVAEGNAQVFWYTFSDVYLSSVRTSLDAALTAKGITFVDQDANATQATQTDQINTAIASGTNLLVVNICETGADGIAQNVVDSAKTASVPLIFFNRSVSQDVVKSYDKCVFVGTNYEEAGIMQGQMIGNYLLANYDKYDLNKDGVISYVMFKGDEANQEAIARTKYGVEDANKILEAAGKPALKFYDDSNTKQYLVDQNGTWSRQVALDYMQTILAQYSEANNNMVELVIANNDEMAIGAVTALQAAGYNSGDKTIPVFGVDATEDAKALIAAGQMAGTIKQDAEGMADAIATISANMIAGTDMFAGLNANYVVTDGWKVAIPYAVYTGE
ncbi:MAG: galactose ABC transporter substrate-binding protein [Candidatus Limiplasma sp.]|nr:galactose ABC transporter substrate-binding protein [Candidatus Limiplasma sp.]